MCECNDRVFERTEVGHCKRDDTDVYVGRGPGGRDMRETPIGERGWLGNPFTTEEYARWVAVELFEVVFVHRLRTDEQFRDAVEDLSGSVLGCWCQERSEEGPACHGEVIAEYADGLAAGEAFE